MNNIFIKRLEFASVVYNMIIIIPKKLTQAGFQRSSELFDQRLVIKYFFFFFMYTVGILCVDIYVNAKH